LSNTHIRVSPKIGNIVHTRAIKLTELHTHKTNTTVFLYITHICVTLCVQQIEHYKNIILTSVHVHIICSRVPCCRIRTIELDYLMLMLSQLSIWVEVVYNS